MKTTDCTTERRRHDHTALHQHSLGGATGQQMALQLHFISSLLLLCVGMCRLTTDAHHRPVLTTQSFKRNIQPLPTQSVSQLASTRNTIQRAPDKKGPL